MRAKLICNRVSAAICCWWTAALVGCGSGGPVVIEPRFTIDGKPLVEAAVTFMRTGGQEGRASFGVTDDQGVARLTTFKPLDGVLPGDYSVAVIKVPANSVSSSIDDQDTSKAEVLMKISAMQGAAPPPRRGKIIHTTLPEVYADPGTTPLKCTVTADSEGREIVFDLTSKP